MKLFISVLALSATHTAVAVPVDITRTLSKRFNINDLISQVLDVFPLDLLINDLQDGLEAELQDVASELGINTTEQADAACAEVTILFARGTDEPGNVGVLAGPAFFEAVQSKLGGNVDVQGTDHYAASIEGFLLGGDDTGAEQLASDIRSTLARCPATKLVVSGYSQGGQLVHKAADIVGDAGMAAVSSVVIFGDPLRGKPVTGAEDKTKIVCHVGDNICDGGLLVLLPHLTYSLDADDAAAFVAQHAGL